MVRTAELQLVVTDMQPQARLGRQNVLVVVEDGPLQRNVERVMRASHFNVIKTEDGLRSPLIDDAKLDLVVFDYMLLQNNGGAARQLLQNLQLCAEPPPVIFLSDRLTTQGLADFIERQPNGNLVAKIGEFDSGDLLVTARKIIENDIFGVEKYLCWGSVIHTQRLRSTEDRHDLLEDFGDFLSELGCRRHLSNRLVSVADELMMNALYDAPTDRRGRPIYRSRPRTEPIRLPAKRAAMFQYGSDGRNVAVGCRDMYGSLDPEMTRKSLVRAMRQGPDQILQSGTGGAGIGLYMIFDVVSHLVINVDPGVTTEFLGLVDVTGSQKDRYSKPKSLNFFVSR